MNQTIKENTQEVISSKDLLLHYIGHRSLTRRVIEAFPEKDLFTFSIGGMRTFAQMTVELFSIAGPGLNEMVTGKTVPFDESFDHKNSKQVLLDKWDEETDRIRKLWMKIPDEQFGETLTLFGQYTGTVISSIFYFIDNEIHHRGQGYVYLRALGFEPPFFYER